MRSHRPPTFLPKSLVISVSLARRNLLYATKDPDAPIKLADFGEAEAESWQLQRQRQRQ